MTDDDVLDALDDDGPEWIPDAEDEDEIDDPFDDD